MREAVQFFVERPELKGLINEQDEEGNTPMHLAAVEGYYKVLLKMAGCRDVDTNATNNESLTAMDQNWLGVELRINLKTTEITKSLTLNKCKIEIIGYFRF
ncbi:hypothetical protein CFP56_024538 [Quercus suber]|uniref:Ankyrin repeat protein n=1 Tax=Quercus suber TaxID=58331 RepID=A0AAW0LYZ5_QUESU